jgi:membrane protease YdiL (CAAX protease family)
MVSAADRATGPPRLSPGVATGVVLALWAPYALYFALAPEGPAGVVLGALPGLLGVGALLLAGFRPGDCFLRPAGLSRAGARVLAAVTLLLVPILATGSWAGWDWFAVLVAAPASGVTQELYFRSALLPVLLRWLSPTPALLAHSGVFALWHLRMLTEMPAPLALVSLTVMFLAGTGWGWQTMRDRTVFWAMAQHSLFLMVMALFTFA